MKRKLTKKSIRKNGIHYRNICFLILSLITAVYLFQDDTFHQYLLDLGNFEYIGAFVAGMFIVSTFTVAPATVALLVLAESMPIWSIALLAGLGGMVGDYILLQFVRNQDLAMEMNDIFEYFGGKKVRHILHLKHFRWMLPVIGAIIVASPLPDEIGVSLMGISKLPQKYFLLATFLLDTFEVSLLLFLLHSLRP